VKTHVRVAVIGGGVVGASVLYHLTRAGWNDVALIERDELTSGSTWHAAGGMHTLNGDPNVAKLQEYTIKLYKEIEEASGQSCSIHITAGVDLAGRRNAWVACARALHSSRHGNADHRRGSRFRARQKHFVGAYNPLEGRRSCRRDASYAGGATAAPNLSLPSRRSGARRRTGTV
jgi:dimethylglycine dehydrogenase